MNFCKACLLSAIIFSFQVSAQTVVEFKDPSKSIFVRENALFFQDSTKKLTLTDIQNPKFTPFFKVVPGEAANFKTTKSAVWCKFTVTNRTDEQLYLEIPYTLIREIDFYCPDETGHYSVTKAGQSRNFSDRDLDVDIHNFNLKLNKGQTKTYYLRIWTAYILIIPLKISTVSQ
ncbi:MAG: hypothetical protein K2Q22_18000, partial [Cytophagales bacterium]|nr:hypothetical protein [Cytophagales bacterium]